MKTIEAKLFIRGIFDILPESGEIFVFIPRFWPKIIFLAKSGDILGHKMVKNDFFKKKPP